MNENITMVIVNNFKLTLHCKCLQGSIGWPYNFFTISKKKGCKNQRVIWYLIGNINTDVCLYSYEIAHTVELSSQSSLHSYSTSSSVCNQSSLSSVGLSYPEIHQQLQLHAIPKFSLVTFSRSFTLFFVLFYHIT